MAGLATVEVDLALVGFGHVARRFVELLVERREILEGDAGLSWRIAGIATRRHGTIMRPAGIDPAAALEAVRSGRSLTPPGDGSAPADSLALIRELAAHTPRLVVVETTPLDIGSGEPAVSHVREALERGAHVITANKGPAAFAYADLDRLARASRRAFLFEPAVMDGVPVFNLVRRTLPAVRVTGLRGIVNSTTNHILSAMEDGRSFEEALADMQQQGVAEADPSHDVDGWDAAAKIAALANVLLGGRLTPHMVDRRGIRDLTAGDVRQSARRGRRLRLVAAASGSGHDIVARVAPVELDAGDPLATLRGMQNGLVFETDTLGEVGIFQLTGGLTATAYGLLSDLIAVAALSREPFGPAYGSGLKA